MRYIRVYYSCTGQGIATHKRKQQTDISIIVVDTWIRSRFKNCSLLPSRRQPEVKQRLLYINIYCCLYSIYVHTRSITPVSGSCSATKLQYSSRMIVYHASNHNNTAVQEQYTWLVTIMPVVMLYSSTYHTYVRAAGTVVLFGGSPDDLSVWSIGIYIICVYCCCII